MYGLAEQVTTIYTTPLSPELAVKFFDDHTTLHYNIEYCSTSLRR